MSAFDAAAVAELELFVIDDLHLAELLRQRQFGTLATVASLVDGNVTPDGNPVDGLPAPLQDAIRKYVDHGYLALDPQALNQLAAA